MDESSLKTKKHKKKHKRNADKEDACISQDMNNSISDCVSLDTEKKRKKQKSKHKMNDGEVKLENENDVCNGISKDNSETGSNCHNDNPRKKKKKRKHNNITDCENETSKEMTDIETCASENINEFGNESLSKKKKRKHELDTSKEVSVVEETFKTADIVEGKKPKKKRKLSDDESNVCEEREDTKDEVLVVDHKVKKKKKRNKKDKDKDSNKKGMDSTKDKQESSCEQIKTDNGLENEAAIKDIKNKINNSTVGINNFNKIKENESVKSGQWSSVELGDSDRQNKFFRLLGGFKKGSDSSKLQNKFNLGKKPAFGSDNNIPRKTGGTFAMNKKQQDEYTQALESEYDRAMSMNLNRGIGLGFEKPPEEGKKFYIDTKSSKSVKFND